MAQPAAHHCDEDFEVAEPKAARKHLQPVIVEQLRFGAIAQLGARLHEADEPDAVSYLLDTDPLAGEQ